MTPLNLLPSISFFLLLTLLPFTHAQGKIALYLDFDCKTPSQLLPTTTFPLSTCIVPVGAVSIAIDALPACPAGSANETASLIMYEDTSCSRNTFSSTGAYTGWHDIANCFYLYISNSIPGVMFTCEEPATDPQPTSTSTVTASIIAGVATGDGSEATTAATATQQGSGVTTPATTSTQSAATTGGGKSTGSSGTSSGLSMSDKIAIGVGVGVGAPSFLVALLAWCWPRR